METALVFFVSGLGACHHFNCNFHAVDYAAVFLAADLGGIASIRAGGLPSEAGSFHFLLFTFSSLLFSRFGEWWV